MRSDVVHLERFLFKKEKDNVRELKGVSSMGRGLAPSPFNCIIIKKHAIKNIKYENKL